MHFADVIIGGHVSHVNKVEHFSEVNQMDFAPQEEWSEVCDDFSSSLLKKLTGIPEKMSSPPALCSGLNLCI